MLVPLSIALAGLVTTKRVSYRGASYGATVVPATTPGRPALVLLPPIGVGIDRTFCGRLVDAWAEAAPGPALHAIDVLLLQHVPHREAQPAALLRGPLDKAE